MYVLCDDSDVHYDYYGLTILSNLASYKFIYLFNKLTKFQFKREVDIVLRENDKVFSFCSFFYKQNTEDIICSLIENKSYGFKFKNNQNVIDDFIAVENHFLFENYPDINFILKIDEDFTSELLDKLNLQQLDCVTSIRELKELQPKELERIII